MDVNQRQQAILRMVRINAPALMLHEGLLEKFLALGGHPEVGLDGRAMDTLTPDDFKEMARRLKNAGCRPTAHGPFLDMSPGARDRLVLTATRERFRQALETAAWFESEHIVFHAGYERNKHVYFRQDWLETSLETWRPVAERARSLGIHMVLENTYEAHPAEMAPILASMAPEGVGFCFDPGHSNVFGQAALVDWLEVLSPRLTVLHLHDNKGDRDEHLALGQGRIDFGTLFNWLHGHNVKPRAVTLEPHEEDRLRPSLVALADLWPWPLE